MSTRTLTITGAVLCLALAIPAASPAQTMDRSFRIRTGIGLEYLNRTLVWDEDQRTSSFAAILGWTEFGLEFRGGFAFSVLAGFSLNDWDGLVFRKLPFSVDYQAGSLGGVLLGAGLEKSLYRAGYWEIGGTARFLTSLGSTRSLALEGLNEAGDLDARGRWMRIEAGPTVSYQGFESFSPFISVLYDRLWGTLTMTQSVKSLSGTEDKAIEGRGFLTVKGGTSWEPTPFFRLRVEGSLLPYKKLAGGMGLDLGAAMSAALSF